MNKEFKKKVILRDGFVDLSKFEMENYKTRKIFKIIRDANE